MVFLLEEQNKPFSPVTGGLVTLALVCSFVMGAIVYGFALILEQGNFLTAFATLHTRSSLPFQFLPKYELCQFKSVSLNGA